MATASGRTHQQYEPLRHMEGLSLKSALRNNPRASALAAAALLVPLGGALLTLSGLVLLATLAGVVLASPLLVLFSPVLVPAALGAALAVAGLATAGTLAVAGLSTLAWIIGYVQRCGAQGGDTGGVAGMVVQPLDSSGKQRHGTEEPAFVGHRLRAPGAALGNDALGVKA
ncbi:oleosin 14.9 kDa [Brachypodium distachyon]|uniref:Oleosin n=1 Tax=Brachypodium distachyon TaxID=15368 RepID=I1J123_BRADI|nr:oleosin 14.9 kDa [Brachypodium distachyon]KQJ84258.1 hypothetical protein BRADI_5g19630v3 [Brachypodium distachyon]|eukprot:XP_003580410.1 oleosin 14.9 kDa [Brachypodium distachyon]